MRRTVVLAALAVAFVIVTSVLAFVYVPSTLGGP